MKLNRRDFVRVGVPAGAAVAGLMGGSAAFGQYAGAAARPQAAVTDRTVSLAGDTLVVPDLQRVQDLAKLYEKYEKVADTYLAGGVVTQLERTMAEILGKEDAAFLPTGTLANNVAVRLLCGEKRHALVQHESHLYRDESDSFSLLSHLNLVPLGTGKACPAFEEYVTAIDEAEKGPYPIAVGAISIESPVRRADGASVPFAMAERVSKLAKEHGIGMHLDGARLFLLAGTPGFELKPYCALFDTVYVSLYKYLGAPFGAMLSGTKEMVAKVRATRHEYGGTIYHGWQTALPALDALPGFMDRMARAQAAGAKVLAGLQAAGGFTVTRVENGSNITYVDVSAAREKGLMERLAKADVRIRPLVKGRTNFMVNETILRRSPEELVKLFVG